MAKILELVGGPPASGKSTYIRNKYSTANKRDFAHLDYDAMVVKEALRSVSMPAQEIRDHASMVYGRERAEAMWGEVGRVAVDWPFCTAKRVEDYMSLGRKSSRVVECNFITVHASEAWKRSLTRHIAGEFNAFTVFLNQGADIAVVLQPSFKMFLEAHRDMPSSVEKVFPQADRAFLWDNNERGFHPVLIAKCVKGGKIEVVDKGRWERFQYKREINIDAGFDVMNSYAGQKGQESRMLFDVKYTNLINRGREKREYALQF